MTTTNQQQTKLHISGELGIMHAPAWHQSLQDALEQSDTLDVDLSGVSAIDTCGIQLMMLAKRSASAQGRHLRFSGHSRAVLEVFELLDLAAYFGDSLLMQASAQSGEHAWSPT
ncbi:MAG: STAS domain-containing protein [Pseudomonadota bacterium]